MGEAKARKEYDAWLQNDPKIYFTDPSDPDAVMHVYDKFRRLEAMFIVLNRAYVRSGVELPIVYEGKILDSEQRKGVESGMYEEVAKQLAASVDVWRGEAKASIEISK